MLVSWWWWAAWRPCAKLTSSWWPFLEIAKRDCILENVDVGLDKKVSVDFYARCLSLVMLLILGVYLLGGHLMQRLASVRNLHGCGPMGKLKSIGACPNGFWTVLGGSFTQRGQSPVAMYFILPVKDRGSQLARLELEPNVWTRRLLMIDEEGKVNHDIFMMPNHIKTQFHVVGMHNNIDAGKPKDTCR